MSFWSQFSPEDLTTVQTFQSILNRIDDETLFFSSRPKDVYSIADSNSLDLKQLPKDGIILQAIWLLFMARMKTALPPSTLKYQTVEEFEIAYPEFQSQSRAEIIRLWHTAQWMTELFKVIPAYKNKGLSLLVIPKLLEGLDVKYVTGSGQKEATANRVKIFEKEGNVKPHTRNIVAGRKPPKDMSSSASVTGASPAVKKTKSSSEYRQHRREKFLRRPEDMGRSRAYSIGSEATDFESTFGSTFSSDLGVGAPSSNMFPPSATTASEAPLPTSVTFVSQYLTLADRALIAPAFGGARVGSSSTDLALGDDEGSACADDYGCAEGDYLAPAEEEVDADLLEALALFRHRSCCSTSAADEFNDTPLSNNGILDFADLSLFPVDSFVDAY